MDDYSFGIIGGDKRSLYLAKLIHNDVKKVKIYGFDKLYLTDQTLLESLEEVIYKSDVIIFPMPATKDAKYLNTPLLSNKIKVDDLFAKMFEGKKIFCGMANKLRESSIYWNNTEIYDYFKREDLQIKNAFLTAEAAIFVAINEYKQKINGSKCLVAGFGRIGKALSSMLKGMGADVTVSARKAEDLAWIECFGYKSIKTSNIIEDVFSNQIIFNTIPLKIFDKPILSRMNKSCLLIDLASVPGGVDFNFANENKIKCVHALALPGKIFPDSAAKVIKDTIFEMLYQN